MGVVCHYHRDIQDKTVGTLSQRIGTQLHGLYGLQKHMESIQDYVDKVCEGKLPLNNPILYQLQDIFNLIPNLNLEEFSRAFAVKTNDMMFVIYMGSIVRSVIALHSLIGNKVTNREEERKDKESSKKVEDDKLPTDKKDNAGDKKTDGAKATKESAKTK